MTDGVVHFLVVVYLPGMQAHDVAFGEAGSVHVPWCESTCEESTS